MVWEAEQGLGLSDASTQHVSWSRRASNCDSDLTYEGWGPRKSWATESQLQEMESLKQVKDHPQKRIKGPSALKEISLTPENAVEEDQNSITRNYRGKRKWFPAAFLKTWWMKMAWDGSRESACWGEGKDKEPWGASGGWSSSWWWEKGLVNNGTLSQGWETSRAEETDPPTTSSSAVDEAPATWQVASSILCWGPWLVAQCTLTWGYEISTHTQGHGPFVPCLIFRANGCVYQQTVGFQVAVLSMLGKASCFSF